MTPRRSAGLPALFALITAALWPVGPIHGLAAQQPASDTRVEFPPTNRPDVRGTHGAVSADHPLAAQAGLTVLRAGGNAVDAALAMATVLAVVRPHMNGVGGDLFALFYEAETGRVTALNASGPAGALAEPAFFRARGHTEVPETGALSVSVPGAVGGWMAAHDRYGTMPLRELMKYGIDYARNGFPVTTRLASDIEAGAATLNEPARALYLPDGAAPTPGSLLRNPALAVTLERIVDEGAAGFYEGSVAEHIGAFIESEGGYLRASDLAAYEPEWTEPLKGEYLGHTLHVMPPNSQGATQLALLEMCKAFDLGALGHNSADYLHTLIELKKLAFADRDRWISDPRFSEVPLDALLDPAYLARRATLVDPSRAATDVNPGVGDGGGVASPGEGLDDSGDTVFLTVVDAQGNAVSWIQSLFHTFGSGLLEPETGVVLQNRGALFTLDPEHPNVIAPGKRPYHTLTPTLALRGGQLAFTLGTPGGDGQTQTLLQIIQNLLVFGMTPQEAIEAPRFRSNAGVEVSLEDRVPAGVRHQLEQRGHDIEVIHGWTAVFGGAQMIRVDPAAGTLTAAADPRREAYALAY